MTQTSTSSTTLSDERRERIDSLVADTHAILERDGLTRDALAHIASALETLAARPELFSRDDFPPPDAASGDTSTRYRLNPGSDGIALYLNSLLPGKTTIAHNHDTWAVIVAVEGSEVNRVYKRTDDRRDDERATIEVDREVIVEPGTPIAFLPDDIHSIHVTGAQPTLHFHLYGRPLETLSGRLGFEDGRIVRYNQTHLHRQTQAVG